MINVQQWLRMYGNQFQTKYMILLVLAVLHKEGKITDAKLKGQLQALRKGTLQKNRRLYHCELNDSWYNDNEPVLRIFTEVASDKCVNSISYQDLLVYINQLEQKGHNHALNVLGSEYIYPIFNSWSPKYKSSFHDCLGFMIPGVEAKISKSTCYECGHEHSTVDKNKTKNLKIMNDWIHQQKKGNLSKIPYHDMYDSNLLYC